MHGIQVNLKTDKPKKATFISILDKHRLNIITIEISSDPNQDLLKLKLKTF